MFNGEVHIGVGGERLVDLVFRGVATDELGKLVGGEGGIAPDKGGCIATAPETRGQQAWSSS